MPEKLGQYLLRHQIVSQEQLNEALQCQVIFGGRLGTNLVELGYVSLDDLTAHLSRRSGFPAASVEELEDLPREILGSIARPIVEKHKVVPIRIEAKTLHCAVCDPTDLKSMDELSFSTGMRLKPYLLPELRMFFLLEKHYGIKRDIRYIRLGRTLTRGKYAGAIAAGSAAITSRAPAEQANAAELEAKGFHPLREGEELSTEAEGQEAAMRATTNGGGPPLAMVPPQPAPVAAPPLLTVVPPLPVFAPVAPPPPLALVPQPPPQKPDAVVTGTIEPETSLPILEAEHLEPVEATPLTDASAPIAYPAPASEQEAAELRVYLATASDREEVAGVALRLARSKFAMAALFIVKGPADPARAAETMILGWKGAGAALDYTSIEPVMVPGNAESILKPASGGVVFHGPAPSKGLNDRLLAALGRSKAPVSIVVVPISVKNRVVNLLYADNGADPVAPELASWLVLLARDVGSAYERIILSKKKSTAEPAAR